MKLKLGDVIKTGDRKLKVVATRLYPDDKIAYQLDDGKTELVFSPTKKQTHPSSPQPSQDEKLNNFKEWKNWLKDRLPEKYFYRVMAYHPNHQPRFPIKKSAAVHGVFASIGPPEGFSFWDKVRDYLIGKKSELPPLPELSSKDVMQLLPQNIRERFVTNCELGDTTLSNCGENNTPLNIKFLDIKTWFGSAFLWSASPEGFSFWKSVYTKLFKTFGRQLWPTVPEYRYPQRGEVWVATRNFKHTTAGDFCFVYKRNNIVLLTGNRCEETRTIMNPDSFIQYWRLYKTMDEVIENENRVQFGL